LSLSERKGSRGERGQGRKPLSISIFRLSDKLATIKDFFDFYVTISLWKYLHPRLFYLSSKFNQNGMKQTMR
jgi:hypothetical protein